MLRFLLECDFPPDAVTVHAHADTRREPSAVSALIESAWKEATARPGVHLFDGPMCRWEKWDATAGHLNLHFSSTTYRIFVGTNLTHPELADQYGTDVMANPVGLSGALLTHDGYLLMGRRNASVAYYPNRVHPFAGALEPRDALNVFGGLSREFEEELRLPGSEIYDPRLIGIVEDKNLRQPELIFSAVTTRTRDELIPTLDATEHQSIWSTRAEPQAIADVLAKPEALTPVAIASLLLWGRIYLDESFFAERRAGFES